MKWQVRGLGLKGVGVRVWAPQSQGETRLALEPPDRSETNEKADVGVSCNLPSFSLCLTVLLAQ